MRGNLAAQHEHLKIFLGEDFTDIGLFSPVAEYLAN